MSFDGRRYEIAAGGYRAVLAEVGACLAGLWHDGSPVTVDNRRIAPDNPTDALAPKSSGAVLLPWPNRVAGGRYRSTAWTTSCRSPSPRGSTPAMAW